MQRGATREINEFERSVRSLHSLFGGEERQQKRNVSRLTKMIWVTKSLRLVPEFDAFQLVSPGGNSTNTLDRFPRLPARVKNGRDSLCVWLKSRLKPMRSSRGWSDDVICVSRRRTCRRPSLIRPASKVEKNPLGVCRRGGKFERYVMQRGRYNLASLEMLSTKTTRSLLVYSTALLPLFLERGRMSRILKPASQGNAFRRFARTIVGRKTRFLFFF